MLTESASAIGTRLRMQTQIIVSRRAMKAGHGHESWQTSQLITTVHNPFCLQIVTECQVNAMFLLVSKLKITGMLLNVVHGQVQKANRSITKA